MLEKVVVAVLFGLFVAAVLVFLSGVVIVVVVWTIVAAALTLQYHYTVHVLILCCKSANFRFLFCPSDSLFLEARGTADNLIASLTTSTRPPNELQISRDGDRR